MENGFFVDGFCEVFSTNLGGSEKLKSSLFGSSSLENSMGKGPSEFLSTLMKILREQTYVLPDHRRLSNIVDGIPVEQELGSKVGQTPPESAWSVVKEAEIEILSEPEGTCQGESELQSECRIEPVALCFLEKDGESSTLKEMTTPVFLEDPEGKSTAVKGEERFEPSRFLTDKPLVGDPKIKIADIEGDKNDQISRLSIATPRSDNLEVQMPDIKGEQKDHLARFLTNTPPPEDWEAPLSAGKGEPHNQIKNPGAVILPKEVQENIIVMNKEMKVPDPSSGGILPDQGEEEVAKRHLPRILVEKDETGVEVGERQHVEHVVTQTNAEAIPSNVSNPAQSVMEGNAHKGLSATESPSENAGRETIQGKDFLLSLMAGLKGTENNQEKAALTGETRPLSSPENEAFSDSGLNKPRQSQVHNRDLMPGLDKGPEHSKEMTDKIGEIPTDKPSGSGSSIQESIAGKAEKADFKTENVDFKTEKAFIGKVAKADLDNGEINFSSPGKSSALKSMENMLSTKEGQQLQKPLEARVLTQIVEKAVLNLKESQSAIKINLKPEILGHLKMQISTNDNQVMLRILTETPLVKQIIESNINQLKGTLQTFGLEIDECNVSVAHDSPQDKSDYESPFLLKGEGDIHNDTNEESALDQESERRPGLTENKDALIDVLA
ncbi:MAG: flagellar hook-length control protein FliK [Thermodesulfobacteriota bacterium]|nr:flagellar hook-length control protein FliK [Thermodesulfobacteriota bacterium]